MSTNVFETDEFPEAVQTPIMGDRFSYPQVVQSALTDLASRTRFLYNTVIGAYAPDTIHEANVPGVDQDVNVPPGSRLVSGGNPFNVMAYQLFSNIVAMRKRFNDATSENVESLNEYVVNPDDGSDIPVILNTKSPVLNTAFRGILAKLHSIRNDLATALATANQAALQVGQVNDGKNAIQNAIWGAPGSTILINVPLLHAVERAAFNKFPDGTTPVGNAYRPSYDGGSTAFKLTQQSVLYNNIAATFLIPYILPGSRIRGFGAYLKGTSGHTTIAAGSLALPTLTLVKQSYNVATTIGTITDTPANVSSYQAEHAFSSGSLNEPMDPNAQYLLDFVGESGTAALAGLELYRLYIAVGP